MTPYDPEPPFLEQEPPPLAARALSIILIVLFGVVIAALVLVTVPETVSAPFRLVTVRGADPVRTLHDGIVRDVKRAGGAGRDRGRADVRDRLRAGRRPGV